LWIAASGNSDVAVAVPPADASATLRTGAPATAVV
jgi:hypothetical protein